MSYKEGFTKKQSIIDTFHNHPEVIFTPRTMSLTTKVLFPSTRRIFSELLQDNVIEKVENRCYRYKRSQL